MMARWLFLFLFLPIVSEAIELKPWFRNDYETEIRVDLFHQNYESIATPHKSCAGHTENDTFSTLNVAYPLKQYLGQFEITGARTRHQSGCIDNYRISGGYQWLSEEKYGDIMSMVTTIILTEPMSRALRDISSFHHGHIEGEFCVSCGQKYGYACSKDYYFRWWQVFGIGGGDIGSPWFRCDAAWEYKYAHLHHFRCFINTLWGMGHENLRSCEFRGYGPVRHQSVDIGFRYGYNFGGQATFNLQYTRRVYARNFPKNVNIFFFEYYMPFGFQASANY